LLNPVALHVRHWIIVLVRFWGPVFTAWITTIEPQGTLNFANRESKQTQINAAKPLRLLGTREERNGTERLLTGGTAHEEIQ
jgi:hypothetical protein